MSVVDSYYNHPQVAAQLFDSYEEAISESDPPATLDGAQLTMPTLLGLAALPENRTMVIAGGLLMLGAALIGTSIYLRRR